MFSQLKPIDNCLISHATCLFGRTLQEGFDIGHGSHWPVTSNWVWESNPGPTKIKPCMARGLNPGPTKYRDHGHREKYMIVIVRSQKIRDREKYMIAIVGLQKMRESNRGIAKKMEKYKPPHGTQSQDPRGMHPPNDGQ